MADDVTIHNGASGTGTSFDAATDDDGSGNHIQLMKQTYSANGVRTPIPADADGLLVNLGSNNDVSINAGTNTMGKVRLVDGDGDEITVVGGLLQIGGSITTTSAAKSRIQVSSAGLTTASTAYSAGDQLGTILEFTSAVASSGGYGTIIGATLLDKAKVVGAVSLYLFDRSVTLNTDNAAADFSDSDMLNCVGILEFPPPTASSGSNSNTLAQVEPLALPYKCNATSLFGALVTRTGHTFFGAVGDLVVSLIVETS